MNNPVGWFEIYVDDMQRAKAFYTAVFGVEFTSLESPEIEMWAFPMNFEAAGATGALVKVPGMVAGKNSVLVYFSCEDCAIEAERATSAGGRLHRAKMSVGEYGFVALAYDTEGTLIGLHSMK
jgi:uncharacterized protein